MCGFVNYNAATIYSYHGTWPMTTKVRFVKASLISARGLLCSRNKECLGTRPLAGKLDSAQAITADLVLTVDGVWLAMSRRFWWRNGGAILVAHLVGGQDAGEIGRKRNSRADDAGGFLCGACSSPAAATRGAGMGKYETFGKGMENGPKSMGRPMADVTAAGRGLCGLVCQRTRGSHTLGAHVLF